MLRAHPAPTVAATAFNFLAILNTRRIRRARATRPGRSWPTSTAVAPSGFAPRQSRTPSPGSSATAPVPASPPITVITVSRRASAQALVAYRGNTYSVPPAHAGQPLTLTHRVDAATLSITTGAGITIAVDHRRTDGAGATVRTEQHVTALNTTAMAATTPAAPHRSKQRIPPGDAAPAAADVLRGTTTNPAPAAASAAVIDLTRYAQAVARRRTLP